MPSPRKRTRSEAPSSSAESSPQEEPKQRTPSPKLSHRLFTFPNAIKRKHRQKQSASSSKQQTRKLPSTADEPPVRQLPKSMMAVPSQEDVVSSGSVAHKILEKIGKLNSRVISLGDDTFEDTDQIVPVKTVESKTRARKPAGTPPDVRELVNAKHKEEEDETSVKDMDDHASKTEKDDAGVLEKNENDETKVQNDNEPKSGPMEVTKAARAETATADQKLEGDNAKENRESVVEQKKEVPVIEAVEIIYESSVTPQHKSCKFEEGERVVIVDGPQKGKSGMLTHKVDGTLAVLQCEDGATLTVNQAWLARHQPNKSIGSWSGPDELTAKEKRDVNKFISKALDANLRQSKLDVDRHLQIVGSIFQAIDGKSASGAN